MIDSLKLELKTLQTTPNSQMTTPNILHDNPEQVHNETNNISIPHGQIMTSTPLSPTKLSIKLHNSSTITSPESSSSNLVVTLSRKSARKMIKDPLAVTAARKEANILSRVQELQQLGRWN